LPTDSGGLSYQLMLTSNVLAGAAPGTGETAPGSGSGCNNIFKSTWGEETCIKVLKKTKRSIDRLLYQTTATLGNTLYVVLPKATALERPEGLLTSPDHDGGAAVIAVFLQVLGSDGVGMPSAGISPDAVCMAP